MEISIPKRDDSVQPPAGTATLVVLSAAVLAGFFAAWQLLETYILAPGMDMRTLHLLHLIRGVAGAAVVATFAGWFLVRHRSAALPRSERRPGPWGRQERQTEHLLWFVRMRWAAIGFTLALIVIVIPLTAMLSADYLPALLLWWAVLVAANVVFMLRTRVARQFHREIVIQIAVDLIVLTGLLNASGGLENPLSAAYLFHVIIAAILLPRRLAAAVAIAAGAALSFLALGELTHVLHHATIQLFPHGPGAGHPSVHAAHDPAFVAGRVVSMVGILMLTSWFTMLITERLRESESHLEAAADRATMERRRLESVIDAAGLGIVIGGSDLAVQWFNERVAEWMGWSREIIGTPLPHEHGEGTCPACLASETVASGQEKSAEVCRRGGGRIHRWVVSPVHDSDGAVAQVVAVVDDITERKALEAEALHASRLSVLGQLAAGIAHEIGNPLSSLNARLLLMKRSNDGAFVRDSVDVLQAQIDRIGSIVRGVSHLARNRREGWAPVDVNRVVAEAASLVRLDASAASVRFEELLQESLPRVSGVRDQLLQVLINLLLNGVEAMPGGGTLRASTTVRDGRVLIAVRDTGPGIPDEVRARLFEPFVTTKSEGTGLGLSICYSLVNAHGGSITAESDPGRGSCFTIDLPACASRAEGRPA